MRLTCIQQHVALQQHLQAVQPDIVQPDIALLLVEPPTHFL